ncbi:MAG TPA: DUF5343 domain-containing protein [Hydrogenophaga sp.]
MATDIPYLVSSKRLDELFSQIQSAAVPDRFTFEFLKKLGFSSSNDRALPSLLKKLGFLDASGIPTQRYRTFRSKSEAPFVLAEGIRELYSDLFSINENIHKESREKIKGAIARVSEAEDRYVNLMTNTFITLCSFANFSTKDQTTPNNPITTPPIPEIQGNGTTTTPQNNTTHIPHKLAFRYNIEIHLPATTEIAVYNAIFKSLREHLGE